MSLLQKISQIPNNYLYEKGKRSFAEYVVKSLPPQDQPTAKKYFQDLFTLQTAADPIVYFQKMEEFNRFLSSRNLTEEVNKSYLFRGNTDFFGWRPAGTKIWNNFPNPFGVFAYFQEQYWAVGRCTDLIRESVTSDGFALKATKDVSDQELVDIYKRLSALNIEDLWVEFMVHEMVFGNFFGMPHYGKKSRELVQFEILYPPRLAPVFNNTTGVVEYYEYNYGRVNRVYEASEVKHAMLPCLFGRYMGTPPLLSCVVELETALLTMNYNNTFMQKGGLLGKILSLKVPEDTNGIAGGVNTDWQNHVQGQLDYVWSGAKAGGGIMAITGVEDVFDINKAGDIELNFLQTRDALDKRICNRLGIPSEKIGIPRSTTAQYQPSLVENVVNAQFDATINSYTTKAARYFNKYILQDELGIYNAKLVPAGRYGAITLAAAQTIKELAAGGPIITINEAREKILGWEPLPANDPRGNMVLDNSTVKDGESLPAMIAPDVIDPELEIDRIPTEKGLTYIKFGGDNSGEIFKGSKPVVLRHNQKD